MSGKMQALVKAHAKEGIWMEDVPIPEVGRNDVKIQIDKTAICGTDIHIYLWNQWAQETIPVPMTVGHEYVGHIVELGSNVEGYQIGEMISGEGHIVCGKCRNCLAGRRHLCKDTKGVGVNRPGAFAEYLVIPAANVWRCSDQIDPELFAIFDPLGNAAHTALTYDVVGEDVLITGAGPIGAMAAAICKHNGARHVVVTDLNDYRLELARKLGADVTVNVGREKLEDVVKRIGMREGFDVGLEMSGNASALNSMIDNMIHGGKIAALGLPDGDMLVDWNEIIFNGLNIKGIYGRKMYETWYKMQAMLESGLNIAPIITHRYDIKEFQKGFDAMVSGMAGKVILDWTSLHK